MYILVILFTEQYGFIVMPRPVADSRCAASRSLGEGAVEVAVVEINLQPCLDESVGQEWG